MSQRFRLGGVLRARKAQEDAAKATVARANAAAEVAAVQVRTRERDLDGRPVPDRATAAAFSASLSARQAIASALSAAVGMVGMAEETVQESIDDLAAAAARRRILEKLAERHAVTRRHTEERAAQLAVDDLNTAAHSRRRGDEGSDL